MRIITICGKVASVEFESIWGEEHRRGIATISIRHGKFAWKTKKKIARAYTWAGTSAKRIKWNEEDRKDLSTWCSSHWDDIRMNNTTSIALHK